MKVNIDIILGFLNAMNDKLEQNESLKEIKKMIESNIKRMNNLIIQCMKLCKIFWEASKSHNWERNILRRENMPYKINKSNRHNQIDGQQTKT